MHLPLSCQKEFKNHFESRWADASRDYILGQYDGNGGVALMGDQANDVDATVADQVGGAAVGQRCV